MLWCDEFVVPDPDESSVAIWACNILFDGSLPVASHSSNFLVACSAVDANTFECDRGGLTMSLLSTEFQRNEVCSQKLNISPTGNRPLRFCCPLGRYEGGRFVVRRKSIQAKELKRVAKERVVARLVYGEGKKSPPTSS